MAEDTNNMPRLPDPSLFDGVPLPMARRWATYLFTRPRDPAKTASLRSRALALYAPTARRSVFPAGLRLCANVYVGCAHACSYCYTKNYIPRPTNARVKEGFLDTARRDLNELAALGLPPVPLHISNSTDPFQERLESDYRHTLGLMGLIADQRRQFTTVTFLTKNPDLAAKPEYLAALEDLRPCQVEVSVAFADEEGRRLYEPTSPTIASRLEGIRRLRTQREAARRCPGRAHPGGSKPGRAQYADRITPRLRFRPGPPDYAVGGEGTQAPAGGRPHTVYA